MDKDILDSVAFDLFSTLPLIHRSINRKLIKTVVTSFKEDIAPPHFQIMKLLEEAAKSGVSIMLPVDVVVAGEINNKAEGKVVAIEKIPKTKAIVDIGPETVERFHIGLLGARTIFWNGPMGVEEIPQFAVGTRAVAEFIARHDATTIIGGGSTAEVIYAMGLVDKISFISTGGGASLKFLGGEELPGVVSLKDRQSVRR